MACNTTLRQMMNSTNKKRNFLITGIAFLIILAVFAGVITADAASIKPKSFTIAISSKQIDVGQKVTVKIKNVKPKNASRNVIWKSSDKTIAKVSSRGVITGVGEGSVKITATSKVNKKLKKSVKIIVKKGDSKTDSDKTPLNIMNSSIGNTVTFGSYKGKPIEWVVLDKADSKVMLFAKYNFMAERAYNNSQSNVSWEVSDLREWLNNEFLNEAFDKSEILAIADTNVNNFEETDGYQNDTVDKVYILSTADVRKYRKVLDKYDAVYKVEWWEKPYVRSGIGTNIWLRDSYDYGSDVGIYHSFVNHYGEPDSKAITQENAMNIRPVIWLENSN